MAERIELINNKDGFVISHTLIGTSAATSTNYDSFYTAIIPFTIAAVSISYSVASTSGTLQVKKLTDGQAASSGTSIFNDSFSLFGTADTTYTKTILDMDSTLLEVKVGDRLAITHGGTITNLSDLAISIHALPLNKGHYQIYA